MFQLIAGAALGALLLLAWGVDQAWHHHGMRALPPSLTAPPTLSAGNPDGQADTPRG